VKNADVIYPDLSYYKGAINVQNQPDGFGRKYDSFGECTQEGIWAEGKFVKSAKVRHSRAAKEPVASAERGDSLDIGLSGGGKPSTKYLVTALCVLAFLFPCRVRMIPHWTS
jgi:hypothetical protein